MVLGKVIITQYFGNTEFATKNAQIYNGKGHTGVDFGASVGTPVKAAMDGIVTGVGNTDLVRTCYSYGKWIFIKHPNGLSTLYAHLSNQTVQDGQTVSTGQTIGYSGNTGYSTGPHLHFGVYATQGVRVTSFDNSINCKGVVLPLADPKAYLNPLSFL
jgi:murein DD-endopeptidase MepM/ murein hydrolase activator NlpD